jgi:seryl-tRNA synthetase
MNTRNITQAVSAIDNLEKNGKRLSDIVNDLNELKNSLSSLELTVSNAEAANKESQKELGKLNSAVEQVQDKLISELRVLIAQGTAEHSSRLKDANEKLIKLEEKIENIHSVVEVSLSEENKTRILIEELDKKVTSQTNSSNLFLIAILITLLGFAAVNLGIVEWPIK